MPKVRRKEVFMDSSYFLRIGIIGLLVGVEAVIAAAEAAIHAVNDVAIREKAEKGDRKAELILRYQQQADGYMSIFQVVLYGTSIIIGAIYSVRLAFNSVKYAGTLEGILNPQALKIIVVVVFSILLLYLVLLFGNLLPRKLALKNPEKTLYRFINVVWAFTCILKPFTMLLDASTGFILFLFRIKPEDLEENVTEEEIISIVNEGHEQGLLEESEVEMIANIIEFDEKEVRDIMTHRKKIVAINKELSVEAAIRFMLKEGYSRCPLYEGDIDNILGILHLKDMMKYYISNRDRNIPLKSVAREPYYVPDTQDIDMLFQDMQSKKIHMAVAIDEYGQTAGLVTMEDIVEEIVGNIFDEYDVEERMIVKQNEGRFLMRGMAPLDEVGETLGISIEHEDFDTLSGLLISLIGRIPAEKERIILSFQGYRFRIIDMKDKTIGFVRVTREQADGENQIAENEKTAEG